jgi:hypothetical protein
MSKMGFPAVIGLTLAAFQAFGATKVRVLSLGRPATVQWFLGPEENKPYELKVRPLFVDGRLKEYTAGSQHDVTERLFVFAADVSAERLASARCDAALEVAARKMVAG